MSEQRSSYILTPTDGEQFIQSLLRMPRLIKINLPNSPVVLENFSHFQGPLNQLVAETGHLSLRVYHGRFYINEKRVYFNTTQANVVTATISFFQEREIQGLKFFPKNDLTPDDVAQIAELLVQSVKHGEALTWFKGQLEAAGITWVQVMTDQDFKRTAHGDDEDISLATYAQAKATMGRKAYSQALSSFRHVADKLRAREQVGMQKPKRVIQNMVELLTEDEGILLGLSTIRDYDDYTYTHSVNVAMLSMCLGKRIGLEHNALGQLGLCGLFHDLGKVDVPIDLIQKPSRLTYEEFELIKTHSLNSVRQIIKMKADHKLKTKLMLPPFEHHLGLNLSGYPQSERKAPLSLFGRIIAICDHYDAMTSDRSYRQEQIRPDQALRMMIDEAGSHLDPVILKIFINMMGVYPRGTLLLLDTREVGLALETPAGSEGGRPRVRLLVREEDGQVVKGEDVDLSEADPASGAFKRNVARCLHPSEYGVQPADFLL